MMQIRSSFNFPRHSKPQQPHTGKRPKKSSQPTFQPWRAALAATCGVSMLQLPKGVRAVPPYPHLYTAVNTLPAPQVLAINPANQSVTTIKPLGLNGISGLAISADGARLYAASASNDLMAIVDIVPGSITYNQQIDLFEVANLMRGVVADPDSRFVAVGTDSTIVFVDTTPGSATENMVVVNSTTVGQLTGQPAAIPGLIWWPVDLPQGNAAVIHAVDTSRFPALSAQDIPLPANFEPQAVCFRGVTTGYATGATSNDVLAFNLDGNVPLPSLSGGSGTLPDPCAVSSDGNHLFVVTDATTVLREYDTNTGVLTTNGTIDNNTVAHSLALAPNVTRAYIMGGTSLQIVDTEASPPTLRNTIDLRGNTTINGLAQQPSFFDAQQALQAYIEGNADALQLTKAQESYLVSALSLAVLATDPQVQRSSIESFILQVQGLVRAGKFPSLIADRLIEGARYMAFASNGEPL